LTPARSAVRWALPAAAVVAWLAAALLWVGSDRRAARATFPAGSVWNTGDDGLSLAFAYLSARSERGARAGRPGVAVLTRRIESAPPPPHAVVFRLEPQSARRLASSRAGEPAGGEDDEADGPEDGDGGGMGKGGKTGKDDKGSHGSHGGKGVKGRNGGKRGDAASAVQAANGAAAPLLTAAEEEWVRGGGRLVLAVAGGSTPLDTSSLPPPGPARKVFPIWPGVVRLLPDAPRRLPGPALAGTHALWLQGDAPVVARLALGAGDVVLLACPEVFHNRLLGRGDHLALLEALAGREGTGAGTAGPRQVWFDERAHGAAETAGAIEILGAWGLGPLLLLAAAAGGAAWWRAAVRVGPADRDDRDDRSEAVELVDSLADLYDRALRREDALRLYYDSFLRTVAADTGLRGGALAARAAELAPGFPPADLPWLAEPPAATTAPAAPEVKRARDADISRAAFERVLELINQAFRRLDDAKRR
jgi:hypothetical protein